MTSYFVLPFSVCGGETKSPCNFTQVKSDLKKEKVRSPNDTRKGYLKTWDQ